MKFQQALEEINTYKNPIYLVHFEWIRGGVLESDYFPDVRNGEVGFSDEETAWNWAIQFAKATKGRTCNLYVIMYPGFSPVVGYNERLIKNR